jgi:hypothetical protein
VPQKRREKTEKWLQNKMLEKSLEYLYISGHIEITARQNQTKMKEGK